MLEADSALALLREEGSAVAFPEAVEQMREDMDQVVVRLGQADVGDMTQSIEEDIIAALEEMIESLQKAQQDLEKQKQQQQQQEGQSQDPPLIDNLAELKMIRSLQMRINMRTKRLARLVEGEIGQADKPETARTIATPGRARGKRLSRHARHCHGEESMNARLIMPLAFTLLLCAAPTTRALEPDALATIPTLKATPLDEVRVKALAWLDDRGADAATKSSAEQLWNPAAAVNTSTTLDRLAATFAIADERVKALVELCGQPRGPKPLAPPEWLTDEQTPQFERLNMRLYYGRWLSQQRLYDESLEQLGALDPADVIDPAALLFFQSVAHHRLLNKTDGLKTIDRLLSEVVEAPPRYVAVAGLMREDLKSLEDESLDHIARRMDDIRRRLDLGRAGEKVRTKEDGVIASLDKLIEEMENSNNSSSNSKTAGAVARRSPISRCRTAASPRSTHLGMSTKRTSADRADGETCRPKSAKKLCSRSGRTFLRIIGTSSNNTSASWPARKKLAAERRLVVIFDS